MILFFSISEHACKHLCTLYRGNHGINEVLRTRGFYRDEKSARWQGDVLGARSTSITSEAMAKEQVKTYVQVDSTIFERSQRGLIMSPNPVCANPDLLSLSIDSPLESGVVTKDSATLQVVASGKALAPLDFANFNTREREKEFPQKRGAKIRVTLDGEELRFTGGNHYEISLQGSLQISFDLLEHGLEANGTCVHLVEVELELDAISSAHWHAPPKAAQSESMNLHSSVRVTSSVAFLFVGEPLLRELPTSSANAPYLELWHPRMVPTTQRSLSAIDHRVDFAAGAEVDIFIEMSPGTMNLYDRHVMALFTLDGSHHDITPLLREELGNADTPVIQAATTSKEEVKRVRLVVEGNLAPGPHTITVTLLERSEETVPLSKMLDSSQVLAQRQMLVASR